MPAKAHHRPDGRKLKHADTFVLDASIALAWFFEDETDDYAESIEDALERSTAVVPSLWALEVANALLVGERRKRTTEATVRQFVALLGALPIAVDDQSSVLAFGEILSLARSQNLSAYDAAYLEIAVRRGLPMATLDRKLRAAASTLGVAVFTP